MLLPATGVHIPSEDWDMIYFQDNRKKSNLTLPDFLVTMLHIPSNLYLIVKSTAQANEYSWTVASPRSGKNVDSETAGKIIALWNELALECLPILRSQADRYGFEGLWDGEIHEKSTLGDGLFEIFFAEYTVAAAYNSTEKLVVRDDLEDKYYSYETDELATLQGKFEGSFWDKEIQNWTRI